MSKTNLFQILISDEDYTQLPPPLDYLAQDLSNSFRNIEYSFWNDSRILQFLKSEFEEDVCMAYESLVPFAYRSDLARYCLLFHFGGWYFDLGTQLANPKQPIADIDDSMDMLFFWDIGDLFSPARSFYDCMNGIIYSKPLNPILRTAIDLVIKNCKEKFYGTDSMSPTGPGVLGRAVAIHGKNQRHYDGHFIQLTPQHSQGNRAYVLRDGTIFAWHRSHFTNNPKPLLDLGVKGGNDYRKLWRDRMIYKT